MSVKRYTHDRSAYKPSFMDEQSDGNYVLHSDYAALLARHNALVEAVKKEHAAFDSLDGAGFQLGPVGSSIWTDHAAARAEVDRLLQEEK